MNIACCSGGGGTPATGYCTSGKGATVTARYSVASTAWNSVISVAVANVGGTYVSGSTPPPLGGYGTGNGGRGTYNSAVTYSTAGGGGSSVALGVSDTLH